jgi:hypothetical protein
MKIIREILSGVGGGISSKRTMTFLAFLAMIGITAASIFMGKEVSQFIYDGFVWIVLGGLFSVASEQFSQKISVKPEELQKQNEG